MMRNHVFGGRLSTVYLSIRGYLSAVERRGKRVCVNGVEWMTSASHYRLLVQLSLTSREQAQVSDTVCVCACGCVCVCVCDTVCVCRCVCNFPAVVAG